jgi:hypothetical protein
MAGMDQWPAQHSFHLPFPGVRVLVLFRVRDDNPLAIGAELAAIVAGELRLALVEPTWWSEEPSAPLDGRLPTLQLAAVRDRRPRIERQVQISQPEQGRSSLGLIHEVGFWAMFPRQSGLAIERLVDRLAPRGGAGWQSYQRLEA